MRQQTSNIGAGSLPQGPRNTSYVSSVQQAASDQGPRTGAADPGLPRPCGRSSFALCLFWSLGLRGRQLVWHTLGGLQGARRDGDEGAIFTLLDHVFLIHSVSLCFLVGIFNPFVFIVIAEKVGFTLFGVCFLWVLCLFVSLFLYYFLFFVRYFLVYHFNSLIV